MRSPFLGLALAAGTWLLFTPFAYANMIWPALFVAPRLLSVPAIVAGLVVETFTLRRLFKRPWLPTMWASSAANAISFAAGLLLLPIIGLLWGLVVDAPIYFLSSGQIGTFHPVHWVGTFFIAMLLTASIEALVLRFLFALNMSRGQFSLWTLANAVSVALAFVSLSIQPMETTGEWYDPWPFRSSESQP